MNNPQRLFPYNIVQESSVARDAFMSHTATTHALHMTSSVTVDGACDEQYVFALNSRFCSHQVVPATLVILEEAHRKNDTCSFGMVCYRK